MVLEVKIWNPIKRDGRILQSLYALNSTDTCFKRRTTKSIVEEGGVFMRISKIAVLLATILILQSVVFTTQNHVVTQSIEPLEIQLELAYTPHSAMNISSNADFAANSWNGSGTAGDPYSISGLSFDTSYPVRIENTTAYFSIENCYFTSGSIYDGTAITMENVTNGNVQSCEFEALYTSIVVYRCNDTTIQTNTMRNVSEGIHCFLTYRLEIVSNQVENVTRGISLSFVFDSSITSNIVHDCTWFGVELGGWGTGSIFSDNEIYNVIDVWGGFGALSIAGDGWLILNNVIHDSPRGISSDFWQAESCNITGNEISDCSQGIYFGYVEDMIILDNDITNSSFGIILWESDNVEIQSNVIDSNYEGISIRDSLHMTITDNQLSFGGLEINGNSPSHFRHEVTGNTVEGEPIGFLIDEEDLEISDAQYGQLFVINCTRVTIENQNLENGAIGITLVFSTECEVSNSVISNNSRGGVTMYYTEDCTVSDCSIFQNGYTFYARGGISLYSSNGTSIVNNMIYMNNGSGIDLHSSTFSYIYNNLVTNNSRMGIELSPGSNDNLIYGNAIGWNEYRNAEDAGIYNSWDDGISLGNWWSNYNSTDSDVYEIEGRSNSQDNYPQEYHTWSMVLPLQSGQIGVEILIISGLAVVAILVVILVVMKKKQIL